MELILISNTKLKIMLDESDMKKYNISSECDCAGGSTRKAIRSLLECAKDKVGFNTDGEEIFVQLYASKRGGCELFVTKCKEPQAKEAPERIKSPILSDGAERERRAEKPPRLPEAKKEKRDERTELKPYEGASIKKDCQSSRIAYSFKDLKSLLTVCKILAERKTFNESRSFCDGDGNFYLLLLCSCASAFSRLDSLTFIIEYGKRENPDCLASYINEHGRVICREKAIETLRNY